MLKWSIIVDRLDNIHRGEVLLEEFLKPHGLSAYRLSKDVGIPQTPTSQILKGKGRITADTALRFAKYLGTLAKCLPNLQMDYDLKEERQEWSETLEDIKAIN